MDTLFLRTKQFRHIIHSFSQKERIYKKFKTKSLKKQKDLCKIKQIKQLILREKGLKKLVFQGLGKMKLLRKPKEIISRNMDMIKICMMSFFTPVEDIGRKMT